MIQFQFFPRSVGMIKPISSVVECFQNVSDQICSPTHNLSSDGVLKIVRPHLEAAGFRVEQGKNRYQKIKVPVLFGLNNTIDKYFDADAISADGKIVVEIEAGRALDNYQFLKDIFQASLMYEVEYLVIAVRNDYRGTNTFARISVFIETLYVSNRIQLPLRGILLIGY
jgi:hypothetical protein